MYTPHNRKLWRRSIIIWIAGIIILAVIFGLLFSPLSPFHMCTQMGCRDTLELSLTHEPPSPYTIQLTSPSGETRRVDCTPGETTTIGAASASCRAGLVTVYDFIPASLTVEVTWLGGSYRMSGSPIYNSFQPNGPFCAPTCRLGKLPVELP